MAEAFFRQAILHGVVAAAAVEALLTTWRIRSASARLKFWLVALAAPFVFLPIFFLAAPYRLDDHFAAGRALFASVRWNAVRVAGWPADLACFAVLASAGAVLLLRDLVPLVLGAWRADALHDPAQDAQAALGLDVRAKADELRALVTEQARALRLRPPAVEVVAHEAPVLFVRGIRTPTVIVSAGSFARLSTDETAAALAHELAHVRFRDPLLGWVLMAARVAMFWNPAVQLVARAIAQETEHRADAAAVRAMGPRAYQAAFRLLMSADDGGRSRGATAWARLRARVHRHHVETRSAALATVPDEPARLGTKLLVVAGTIAVVLFFVV